MMDTKDMKLDTKLTHLGRDPDDYHGVVNPPIARTSTILYPNLAAYENPDHQYRYGRLGNPMSDAFESAMAELEGGYKAVSTQTGMSAITTAILSVVKTGDHLLMVDTAYPPVRGFCSNVLERMGVEVEYYDPCIGAGIEQHIKDNTSVVYLESPGSATFEVQDVPAITEIAKSHSITTIADNTWSAGLLFNPIQYGVDLCLQSATKYIGGHSDVNLGVVIAANEALYAPLKQAASDLGVAAGAEDMYLSLRGLRSLTTRMKQNNHNAMEVLEFLKEQKEIERIYCPMLETHPTHDIWKRDFSGGNGLFSILLKPYSKESVHEFVNALELFPIGSSWGGYESLCQPQYLDNCRTAVPWEEEGALLRFQVGFEDPQDLIADFEKAFINLKD